MWGALAAGIAVGGATAASYAALCPWAQVWGRSVWRGPSDRRAVALTFDDGPSETTPAILERLARFEARATFFACGRNVDRRPDLAAQVRDAGHELGNHTYTHPFLLTVGPRRLHSEIEATQRAIAAIVGRRPGLFRAPWGVRAPALRGTLERAGLTHVHWTVIGNDWRTTSAAIARRVLERVTPGSIVCLHDGWETYPGDHRSETARALDEILPRLASDGYQFVTVGDMLNSCRRPPPSGQHA